MATDFVYILLRLFAAMGIVFIIFKTGLFGIRTFLYRMFWVRVYQGENPFFYRIAKWVMYGYVFFVFYFFLRALFPFDAGELFLVIMSALFFPVIYWLVMGVQRLLYRL
ncbi:MAG: hypothetical protein H0Z33_15195 [Bacillaceae bacterium]|nr:hypothetical protein [Bacillaceae bacterium]